MTYADVISKTTKHKHHKRFKCKKRPWTIKKKKKIVQQVLYDVENVLAKRSIGKCTEYFVSWHGFESHDNQWISELPSFFEEEWGASAEKPFMKDNVFEDIVELACRILSGRSEIDVMNLQ
jgi:hypothetical protein